MAGGGRFPGSGRIHYAGRAWDVHLGRQLDEDLKAVAASAAILQSAPGVAEPVALGDESVASAGTSQKPAVEDHVHNLETAAPSSATGKTPLEGTAESVMRSDARIAQGIVTTKGDLLVHDGTTAERLASPGVFGYQLITQPGVTEGLSWESLSFLPVLEIDSDYAVGPTDDVILVDATSGPVTVTLPDPTLANVKLTIKKIDGSANVVTIDGDGANIDGRATYALTARNQAVSMVSSEDSAAWWIVSDVNADAADAEILAFFMAGIS